MDDLWGGVGGRLARTSRIALKHSRGPRACASFFGWLLPTRNVEGGEQAIKQLSSFQNLHVHVELKQII